MTDDHTRRAAVALDGSMAGQSGLTDYQRLVAAETERAPQAIWALRSRDWGWDSFIASGTRSNTLPQVHYIRADLARPSQAGDERAARAAMEAAQAILNPVSGFVRKGDAIKQRKVEQVRDQLRAALAAMDTPKGGGDE